MFIHILNRLKKLLYKKSFQFNIHESFWYLFTNCPFLIQFDYVMVFSVSLFTAFLLTHKSSQNFYFFFCLLCFLYFSSCGWTWERPQFVANLVILANICFNISDILFSISLAQEFFEVNCIRHRPANHLTSQILYVCYACMICLWYISRAFLTFYE